MTKKSSQTKIRTENKTETDMEMHILYSKFFYDNCFLVFAHCFSSIECLDRAFAFVHTDIVDFHCWLYSELLLYHYLQCCATDKKQNRVIWSIDHLSICVKENWDVDLWGMIIGHNMQKDMKEKSVVL